MDGREFYRFVNSSEGRGRYFIDLGDVALEATKSEYIKWRKEKDHSDYLREWEEDIVIVSLYAIVITPHSGSAGVVCSPFRRDGVS